LTSGEPQSLSVKAHFERLEIIPPDKVVRAFGVASLKIVFNRHPTLNTWSRTMEILETKKNQPTLPAHIVEPQEPPLNRALAQRIEQEFMPRWRDSWNGRFVLHGRAPGANAVRLDGNDYLSLTGHPDITRAQIASLRRDNEFVIQSGAFVLGQHPSRAFELEMAQWIGKEDGFLCQSGYAANVGLLQCIANAQTPVFIDTMAHTSLWEGAHTARASAYAFRHNDPSHLDKTLGRYGPGVVVVDSVYSTTGAVSPLLAMVQVVEKHGAMIVVDESHSLGTHGPGGSGLVAALKLTHRVHFITASLAKTFAGRAGFFTMPAALRYYVLSTSFPNIFSSCMLPHEVSALAATLGVIRRSDEARSRLHALTRRVRDELNAMGYPIDQGSEQIIALEAGSEQATMALRDELEARGVFGSIFCAPATSRNRALVRLTINAGLTDTEIEHTLAVAKELAPLVRPWDWSIARKANLRSGQAARP
jgi:CAI-1 autoinducer synthase